MRLISLDVPYPADVKLDVTAEMVNVIAVDVDAVNGKFIISSSKFSRYIKYHTRKFSKIYCNILYCFQNTFIGPMLG